MRTNNLICRFVHGWKDYHGSIAIDSVTLGPNGEGLGFRYYETLAIRFERKECGVIVFNHSPSKRTAKRYMRTLAGFAGRRTSTVVVPVDIGTGKFQYNSVEDAAKRLYGCRYFTKELVRNALYLSCIQSVHSDEARASAHYLARDYSRIQDEDIMAFAVKHKFQRYIAAMRREELRQKRLRAEAEAKEAMQVALAAMEYGI